MENQKAFPLAKGSYCQKGMELRDYFAAKAMQAILSNDRFLVAILTNYDSEGVSSDAIASEAYSMADAMMRERSKRDE